MAVIGAVVVIALFTTLYPPMTILTKVQQQGQAGCSELR